MIIYTCQTSKDERIFHKPTLSLEEDLRNFITHGLDVCC